MAPDRGEERSVERGTQKFSTILVATGDSTATYKSVAEMPPSLRRKLLESTSSPTAGTLVIADERGRREIERTLERPSSNLEARLVASLARKYSTDKRPDWLNGRHAAEAALVAGIGFCLWLLANWR